MTAAAATRELTGGQAVVEQLKIEGIDTLFALPGIQLDGLFDAIYDAVNDGSLRVFHSRHEQTTAYMADGWARSTGKIGTCVVVPGPGLMNALAALSTAYAANSPVLCISGQIQSDMIEFGRGLLHEIPNQLGMVRSATKHAERAVLPEEVPGVLNRAIRTMWEGRVRPVEIEVPQDTLFQKADVQLMPAAGPRPRREPNPDEVEAAAKLLGGAKNPVIFAGGGVIGGDASEELRQLAELLQAPVVMTNNGKGALSSRHPLAQHGLAAIDLVPRADVLFAVGTRFADAVTLAWKLEPGRTVVQLDVDPEEIGRNYPVTAPVLGDVRAGLAALIDRIPAHSGARPDRTAEYEELDRKVQEKVDSIQPQAGFAHAIRNELPDEGIWVSEQTQIGYWANLGLPVYNPRTFIGPTYQGTLGYGFPTALGVQVAHWDTPVVSVNGDGGFGFALAELATQAQFGIPLVSVVFDDGAYGNVRRIQQEQMNGRTIASDLKNPDFRKLADAFGVTGRRAETPEELATHLREGFASREPTLIHVPVKPMPNPWTAIGLR
jgi:acetolactate synthase-1/2/3 large subunit